MNNTCRKFLLILADTMLRINTQISHWMVRCHSASPLATPLMHCSTALVQRHPQTARKIVSCFGPSVTVLLLLGASHCAVVESDAVVLTTFDLEQQQPMFQVIVYSLRSGRGWKIPAFSWQYAHKLMIYIDQYSYKNSLQSSKGT